MPPQRGSRQPSAGWTGLAQRRRRGGRTSSVAPAFAGRDMRRARVTERSTLASGPDPRCISGRPPRRPPFGRRRRPTVGPDSAPSSSPGGHARPPLRARQDRRAARSGVGRHFGCCAAFAPMAWVEAWYGRLDPLEGRGMPHAEAVQWTEERTPAPASAHRRMVVRQLPRFALCWLGIAATWHAILVVESLISPRDALLALAGVAAVAFAAVALCRAHPEAPRVIPIVVVASVLLGVAENARELIFTTDRSGRFTYVNPAFARCFGVTPEELLGRASDGCLSEHPSNAEIRGLLGVPHATSGPPSPCAFEVRTPQATRWLEASPSIIRDGHGQVVGVRAICHDVTERKELDRKSVV